MAASGGRWKSLGASFAAAALAAACSAPVAAADPAEDAPDAPVFPDVAADVPPDVADGAVTDEVAPDAAVSDADAVTATLADAAAPDSAASDAGPDGADVVVDATDATPTVCPSEPTPTWATTAVASSLTPLTKPPGATCAQNGWPSEPATAPLKWTDITAELGLTDLGLIDACVLLQDLNGDALLDILTVVEPTSPIAAQALRVDLAKPGGGFATTKTPLAALGQVQDCAAGDVNGDGMTDVILATQTGARILLNQAGAFTDATAVWLPQALTPTGMRTVAIFDADRDGLLDVVLGSKPTSLSKADVVCYTADASYLMCCFNALPECVAKSTGTVGLYACCTDTFPPVPKYLLRNTGTHFQDVTPGSGLTELGNTQTLAAFDIDRDGWTDLFWGDDLGQHGWLRNAGGGHFSLHTTDLGMRPYAHAMGSALGDIDGDHYVDLAVSSVGPTILYRGQPNGFIDGTEGAGTGWLTQYGLPWALAFVDLDADGWLDMLGTQSFVASKGKLIGLAQSILASAQMGYHVVGHNTGGGFQKQVLPWAPQSTSAIREMAMALGDIDGDGDVDLLIESPEGLLTAWRNDATQQHWLRLRLQGKGQKPTSGALVQVWKDGFVQERVQQLAGGFGVHTDGWLAFGLGAVQQLDVVRVWWPSGQQTEWQNVQADQALTLVEP